jgi:hypothetical protein
MKKLLLFLSLLALAAFAGAQELVDGSIRSSASSCQPQAVTSACVFLQVGPQTNSADITVRGTYSGTLQFEVSGDAGATWVSVNATPPNSSTAVTSTTSTGTWTASMAGHTFLRVRASAFASGVANVTLNPSQAVTAGTGGGGSMTYPGAGIANSTGSAWGTSYSPTVFAPGANIFYVAPACGSQPNCFVAVGDASTDNSTVFAALATAVNAYVGGSPIDDPVIDIAGGQGSTKATYKYASGLNFIVPVTIRCQPQAVLDYTGSAHAIDLGSASGTVGPISGASVYRVTGCGFTGGASMTEGIYINGLQALGGAESVRVDDNQFYDFGNSTSTVWQIYANAEVDDFTVEANKFNNDDNTARNGVYAAGSAVTQLHFDDNFLTNWSQPSSPATNSGILVWTGGIGSRISQNNLNFCDPCVRVDSNGTDVRIMNNYMEAMQTTSSSTGVIQYGTPSTGGYVDNLLVDGLYVHLHGETTVMAPTASGAGLRNASLKNININNYLAPVVITTATAGQTGNEFQHIVNGYPAAPPVLLFGSIDTYGYFQGYYSTPAQPNAVTDNFTRTNAATLGQAWTVLSGDTSLRILSNVANVAATQSAGSTNYTGQSFSNDQGCRATVGATASGYLVCRVRSSGASATRLEYYYFCSGTHGRGLVRGYPAGTFTTLQTSASNCSATDTIEIDAVGSYLLTYYNGVPDLPVTVDTNVTSGVPGIQIITGSSGSTADTISSFTAWSFPSVSSADAVYSKPMSAPLYLSNLIYSAAGTALPTCAVGIKGAQATVSDALTPLYMIAYSSGGGITTEVICSFNGTTYTWLTH